MRIFVKPENDMTPPSHDGLAWEIFQAFFIAREYFLDIYEIYEDRVMSYAGDKGVDRLHLQLDATELSALLDFTKLEILRERHLEPLRDLTRQLFRKGDTTDPLDRLFNESFHEASILKEEQYKLLTFASTYTGHEIKVFLAEIHRAFPARVHKLRDIFHAALKRLFELLPQAVFREDRIFLRSLYLYGEDLLGDHYSERLDVFWRRVFLDTGTPGALLTVAESFLASGFRERAFEAVTKAKGALAGADLENQKMRATAAAIESLELSLSLRGGK